MVKRRTCKVLVTLSYPDGVTAAQARREARTLINENCAFALDYGAVKVRQMQPVKSGVTPAHAAWRQGRT